jgi:hypothetical protein
MKKSRVFWTVEQAAEEVGAPVEEVRGKLAELQAHDDKYLVEEIIEILNPTLSSMRSAERSARTDFIELRNAILKGELVERDPMEREAGLIARTIDCLILGSTLSRTEQYSLRERIEDCKNAVVEALNAEHDPDGIWAD